MKRVFEQRLASDWPVDSWQEVTVIVAVSGGADSVALLRALHALKAAGAGRLIAAHCNHGLRGADSDADADFVRRLCAKLQLPCEVGLIDLSRADRSDGLEAIARAARYEFLTQVAYGYGARYLATAHTADDQAETILHRILRGTGLAGLAGIPRVRPRSELTTLIRPILWARRCDVLAYLSELNQDFRQDATNLDSQFTRNRLRNELLPQLAQQYNSGVVEALLRLGQLAGEAQEVLTAEAHRLKDEAAVPLSNGWRIDALSLHGEPRYVIREMLIELWRQSGWPQQAMGLAEWERLAEFICPSTEDLQPARQVLPGNITAEWDAQWGSLLLTRSN